MIIQVEVGGTLGDVWPMITAIAAGVSAIAAVVIAIIAGRGLRSLQIAKDDIVLRATAALPW